MDMDKETKKLQFEIERTKTLMQQMTDLEFRISQLRGEIDELRTHGDYHWAS